LISKEWVFDLSQTILATSEAKHWTKTEHLNSMERLKDKKVPLAVVSTIVCCKIACVDST